MRHLAKLARLGAAVALVGPGAACTLDGPAAGPPAESTTRSSLCSIFYCGDNAASDGDNYVFDELDLFGRFSYAGMRITGASLELWPGSPRVPAELGLDRHFFYADEVQTGTRRSGHELVKLKVIFSLEHESGHPDGKLDLLFDGYDEHTHAFQAGDPPGSPPDYFPVYRIKVKKAHEHGFNRDICNPGAPPPDPLWSTHPHHAIAYRGDRYHPTEKHLLENDPADGWFFLACAGSAAAKMHVFRHTHAGSFRYHTDDGIPDFPTSLLKRTVLLKALTADLCGDGSTFTVNGQPLAFAVNAPFMPSTLGTVSSIEAIWSTGGALCINQPRREAGPGVPAPSWSMSDIELRCGRPFDKCDDFEVQDWPSYGYAITANP